jgi:hypothetical protein
MRRLGKGEEGENTREGGERGDRERDGRERGGEEEWGRESRKLRNEDLFGSLECFMPGMKLR